MTMPDEITVGARHGYRAALEARLPGVRVFTPNDEDGWQILTREPGTPSVAEILRVVGEVAQERGIDLGGWELDPRSANDFRLHPPPGPRPPTNPDDLPRRFNSTEEFIETLHQAMDEANNTVPNAIIDTVEGGVGAAKINILVYVPEGEFNQIEGDYWLESEDTVHEVSDIFEKYGIGDLRDRGEPNTPWQEHWNSVFTTVNDDGSGTHHITYMAGREDLQNWLESPYNRREGVSLNFWDRQIGSSQDPPPAMLPRSNPGFVIYSSSDDEATDFELRDGRNGWVSYLSWNHSLTPLNTRDLEPLINAIDSRPDVVTEHNVFDDAASGDDYSTTPGRLLKEIGVELDAYRNMANDGRIVISLGYTDENGNRMAYDPRDGRPDLGRSDDLTTFLLNIPGEPTPRRIPMPGFVRENEVNMANYMIDSAVVEAADEYRATQTGGRTGVISPAYRGMQHQPSYRSRRGRGGRRY